MKEWHHAYLGMAMILIGFLLVLGSKFIVAALIIIILGFLIFLDDLWQEIEKLRNPEYRSPLHIFIYGLHWKWINDLSAWFDRLLGKK
jgi:heme/copper-type cytochrome/quinol oxidase subunit 2